MSQNDDSYVDGCFVDRAVDGTPTDGHDDDHPSGKKHNLTNTTTQAYAAGHVQMLIDL